MPAKNIECQLAQGQIGRYINGDLISADAVVQLEAHVSECDDCKQIVAQRKRAIMSMLGEGSPAMAVVEVESPIKKLDAKAQAIAAFTSRAKAKATVQPEETVTPAPGAPKPKERFISKPILYCSALAVVLIGMSYFSHGALQAFGPTSNDMLAKTPAPNPVTPAAPTANTTPPVVKTAAVTQTPKVTAVPAAIKTVASTATPAPAPAAPTSAPETNGNAGNASPTGTGTDGAAATLTTSGRSATNPAPERPFPSPLKAAAITAKPTPKPAVKPIAKAKAHAPAIKPTAHAAPKPKLVARVKHRATSPSVRIRRSKAISRIARIRRAPRRTTLQNRRRLLASRTRRLSSVRVYDAAGHVLH